MGGSTASAGFCPACGSPVVEQEIDQRQRHVCPSCDRIRWNNAKPCAGALVIRNGKVLLVRRSIEPFRGYWDIPGGFCEADEHPLETALREVREETGLEIELTGLVGIWLDEYMDKTTLNIYYFGRPLSRRTRFGDDAAGLAWFSPDALPARVAFDNGRRVLALWASDDVTPVHLRGAKLQSQTRSES